MSGVGKSRRLRVYVISILTILLVGVIATAIGPSARAAIREGYYHRWAVAFEKKWPCVDVLGIHEGENNLVFVLLILCSSSQMDAEADAFFDVEMWKVAETAEFLGYYPEGLMVAVTDSALFLREPNLMGGVMVWNRYKTIALFWPVRVRIPLDWIKWPGLGK